MTVAVKVTTTNHMLKVAKAAEKAAFKNFSHAAASISKDVKATLEKAPQGEASEPGTPPHTHRGTFLKRGVRYAVDKAVAVIGPMASVVGEVGTAHEFGGEYKDQEFPERSFMFPALQRAIPRFAGEWRGSIGE